MRIAMLGALLALASCAEDGESEAPVTGPVYRFVVDRIDLPRTSAEARALASDLDGDSVVDNVAGTAIAALGVLELRNEHEAEMLASGAVASVVEIQADDLVDDESVYVWYRGRESAAARPVRGALRGGVFTAAARPGGALVVLPAIMETDPAAMDAVILEVELVPDGADGYELVLRGAVRRDELLRAAGASLAQMVAEAPAAHDVFVRIVDPAFTGNTSAAAIAASEFLGGLLSADLDLYAADGRFDPGADEPESVSLAFGAHVRACAAGRCAEPPAPTCFDRVRNAAETAVDCGGGACRPCAGGFACAVAADCQEGACEGGACRAPSCSDGVRNGFESDVDCGYGCDDCGTRDACLVTADCGIGTCNAGICQ